jgi:pimeloyl-ACP methyl ester carboxylesterase
MENKKGFLLLPGGGMSAWIWEKVIPLLDAPSIAPLYRLEENNVENRKKATIQDCINYHKQLIEASKLEKVIVVGHSGAGALAAAIAKEIGDKIPSVIYISANIPKNHFAALDSLPLFLRLINKSAITSQVKVDSRPMQKNAKTIKKYFCNACDDKVFEFVISHEMLSEPLCLAFEKYDYDDFPKIRQVYVVLSKDKTQTVEQQEKMMKNLDIQEKRQIESDHMVMLSKPEELANILNEVIRSA